MATISRVTTWSDGQVLTASALNGEFNNILNDYNGGITNANISASAAIALTKLAGTFPASGLIVGTTDTQTLTNKTINDATNTVVPSDAQVTNRKIKLDKIQYATRTSNVNTTSTSYADYTDLTVTFTPDVASTALVLFSSSVSYGFSGNGIKFKLLVDGVLAGNDPFATDQCATIGNIDQTVSGFLWVTGLTAGAHTIKIQQAGVLNSGGSTSVDMHYGSLTVIPFAS